VTDLDEWTEERLRMHSVGDVLAAIGGIVGTGPRGVRHARSELRDALAATPLPGSPAYAAGAGDEARRTDFKPADFIDDDLKPKPALADEWRAGIGQLAADAELLEQLSTAIDATLRAGCQEEPREAVARAQAALELVATPETVAGMNEKITDAKAVYLTALKTANCRKVPKREAHERSRTILLEYLLRSGVGPDAGMLVEQMATAGIDSVGGAIARVVERARSMARQPAIHLRGKQLWRETLVGEIVTAAAAALVIGFAGATVWEAAYEAKPAFAGFADYFALFSAALASGAAASVLSLLAFWRPQPSA
jgi:hypothetical protein